MKSAHRSSRQLLDNIVTWGERLSRFLDGVSRKEFEIDELRQAAASKCIEAIGEACGEIMRSHPQLAETYPQLGLAQAYRARNGLSHGYDSIDWEILWDTATCYVPELVAGARDISSKDNVS